MYNKQFSKRHFTVMLAMVAALVLLAASALATEPGAEVTVIGGTLSGGDIIFSNLTDIELDGTANTGSRQEFCAHLQGAERQAEVAR